MFSRLDPAPGTTQELAIGELGPGAPEGTSGLSVSVERRAEEPIGLALVAGQALTFGPQGIRFARRALVNGAPGFVVAPRGRPVALAGFTVARGKIVEIDVLADPARLRELDLTLLEG